jgi:hypothetical protein
MPVTKLLSILINTQQRRLGNCTVMDKVLRDIVGSIYLLFCWHALLLFAGLLSIAIVRCQHGSVFLDREIKTFMLAVAVFLIFDWYRWALEI